ncbi:AraC family transcriptional regulator [Algibacter sp. R77976]
MSTFFRTTHNYFTKTFKKEYGKTPSEFIKDNH